MPFFDKFWALLGALVVAVGGWLWGGHQAKRRREAEVRAKVAERLAETVAEQGVRREKVDSMSDNELVDRLRR